MTESELMKLHNTAEVMHDTGTSKELLGATVVDVDAVLDLCLDTWLAQEKDNKVTSVCAQRNHCGRFSDRVMWCGCRLCSRGCTKSMTRITMVSWSTT